MYEGFEGATFIFGDGKAENGKVENDLVQIPGTHSFKLGEHPWAKGDKVLWTQTHFGALKLPGGMDPNSIYVSFSIWSDELGEVKIYLKDGDFEKKEALPKIKAWCPILIKLSETTKDGKHPKPDQNLNYMEIQFRPRDKNKDYPKTYIDDVCITSGVKPSDILPKILAADRKRATVVRNATRDGFEYSLRSSDTLKSALKASTRPRTKTIVLFGLRPGDGETLLKGLNTEASKIKATGLKCEPATAPDGQSVSGLDDMRTLLSYNIQKKQAEAALLMLGYADAIRPGRPSEYVRTILERTLAMGCVPIVCLPAHASAISKDDGAKLDTFNNTVTNLCIQLGVPWVEESFAIKGEKSPPFDGNELNAQGVELLGELAMSAIKHIDQFCSAK